MNQHQKLATDDIPIFGIAALVMWFFTVDNFGWGKLIVALIFTLLTAIRMYHLYAWSDEKLHSDD